MKEKTTPFPSGDLSQETAIRIPVKRFPLHCALTEAHFQSKSAQWEQDRKKEFIINIKQPDNALDYMIVSGIEKRRELFNSVSFGSMIAFWICFASAFLGIIAGLIFYFSMSATFGTILISIGFISAGLARCLVSVITNIDRIGDLSIIRWRKRSITAETANLPENVQTSMQDIACYASAHGIEPCFYLTELDHPFIRGNILSVFSGSEDYFIMAWK
jgi:hypothetical protein